MRYVELAFLVIVAFVPPLALTAFFYLKDRYEPEPKRRVAIAFFYGFLVLIPALYIGRLVRSTVDQEFLALGGLRADLFRTFVVAALPEEGAKFLLLCVTVLWWRDFDEPFDGVVYGAALSLGLAAVENLFYVLHAFLYSKGAWKVALLRGTFAVPAHALFGATMGYFLGLAKFGKTRAKKLLRAGAGLCLASVFHGLYDLLCQFTGAVLGWILLGGLSLAMWVFVLMSMSRLLAVSPFKDKKA